MVFCAILPGVSTEGSTYVATFGVVFSSKPLAPGWVGAIIATKLSSFCSNSLTRLYHKSVKEDIDNKDSEMLNQTIA